MFRKTAEGSDLCSGVRVVVVVDDPAVELDEECASNMTALCVHRKL